jgi:IS5 family transposase
MTRLYSKLGLSKSIYFTIQTLSQKMRCNSTLTEEKTLLNEYVDVFIYCFIDDFLQASGHIETGCAASLDAPKMSDSEILFVFILSCRDYGGNQEKALNATVRHGLIRVRLSKSQFNRRLHQLADCALAILMFLGELAKNTQNTFSLDSFPLPVCKNIRIKRCKIVKGEQYRGRCESKKEWYYGYKAHLITAKDGRIIEIEFTPAAWSDQAAFDLLNFDLPQKAQIFADKAYNVYAKEDELNQAGYAFEPIRKKNSKKEDNKYVINRLRQIQRRHIETNISVMEQAFPKTIHAVTSQGFLLKAIGFCIAFGLNFYL